MFSKKITSTLALVLALSNSAVFAQQIEKPSKKTPTSFAIVVDQSTYAAAINEIKAYKSVVEADGLGTYIISHDWTSPDQIREILHKLYKDKASPIEGAVLVGKIPVPMLRDAQFMTSALKMNQKIRWDKSSVPSDRYYDDFDLQFDYLKQDTAKGREQYHYYSLKAESPQFLEMDIYTARIKPPVEAGEDMIPKIKDYLRKVVSLRQQSRPLKDMIVSYGHGYNSNAVNSIVGEATALKGQFPHLFTPKGSIKFLNYRNAEFMKFNLLTELKREGLDFAFMTGHGTDDLQLISGYPEATNPQPSMANVARYIRGKMRDAKDRGRDLEKVKADFQQSLGLNDKWFEDAFDPKAIEADSLYNLNMDVQISDVKDANIKATVAYLNSCLTGSFQLDNYIAGYYPFSKNENLVAIANSVGVLQDLWPSEFMGLLKSGFRVGNWVKEIAYLETHILGDPTFHYAAEGSDGLNQASFLNKDAKYWKNMLKQNDADIQALALKRLTHLLPESQVSPLLKSYYFDSAFESTRMQAFQLLSQYENKDFFEVLHAAKNDPYEYIRRRSTYYLTDLGADEFVRDLIQFSVSDPHSERTNYRLNWAIQFMNSSIAHQEVDRIIRQNPNVSGAKDLADKLDNSIKYADKKKEKLRAALLDSTLSEKELLGELTSLRLYRHHSVVPEVIQVAQNSAHSDDVRITALEALGWFTLSYQRDTIIKGCEAIISSDAPAGVKKEALKTKNRIKGNSHKI